MEYAQSGIYTGSVINNTSLNPVQSNASNQGNRFFLNNPLPPNAYDPLDGGGSPRQWNNRGDDEEEVDDEDEEEEEAPVFYPGPMQFIQEIIRALGKPGKRHECFACRYVGMGKAAKIPDERLSHVFKVMAESIGVGSPPAAAIEFYQLFSIVRKEVNAGCGDREPIPEFTAASILDHWFWHTEDPEIHQWLTLFIYKQIKKTIISNSLVRYNRKTKRAKIDKEQFAILRDADRMWFTISSKECRKLSYYREGTMFDRKGASNGGLVRKGRPVYQFFGNKKRRRTVSG